MKKTFSLSAVFLIAAAVATAQHASMLMGARGMGLGNTASCLSDEWSLFNNAGGLAKVDHPACAFSYDANPSFPSFNRMAASFVVPAGIGTVGAGAFRFGDDLYNEQVLSAGFANTLGLASLGATVSYIQYQAEGFGSAHAVTASMGGIAEITPGFLIAAHVFNINQPRLSKVTGERVPTILILGAAAQPSENLLITAQVEKDLDYKIGWSAGIEYRIHKKISARTGVDAASRAGFGGFGLRTRKFNLDYAFGLNMFGGHRHQASVSYRFRKK